ncbi:MAG: hypothetical protein JWO96_484 [Candidatus Saccharibacteria bacterium]|nr:hypothetical protein [Candidatus Saccharibacteria bacterium]
MPRKAENLRPGSPEWRASFLYKGRYAELEAVEDFSWWLATHRNNDGAGPTAEEIDKRTPPNADELFELKSSFGYKLGLRNKAIGIAIEMRRQKIREERAQKLQELETAIKNNGIPALIFEDVFSSIERAEMYEGYMEYAKEQELDASVPIEFPMSLAA